MTDRPHFLLGQTLLRLWASAESPSPSAGQVVTDVGGRLIASMKDADGNVIGVMQFPAA